MDPSRRPTDTFPLPAAHCRYDPASGQPIVSQAWVAYVLGRNRTTIREWLDAGRLTCVVTGQSNGSRRVVVDAALASLYRAHQRRAVGSQHQPIPARAPDPPPLLAATPTPPTLPDHTGLVRLGADTSSLKAPKPAAYATDASKHGLVVLDPPSPPPRSKLVEPRRPRPYPRRLVAVLISAALAGCVVFLGRLDHRPALSATRPLLAMTMPAFIPLRQVHTAVVLPRPAGTIRPVSRPPRPHRHAGRRRWWIGRIRHTPLARPPAPFNPAPSTPPSSAPSPAASSQCGFGPCSRF